MPAPRTAAAVNLFLSLFTACCLLALAAACDAPERMHVTDEVDSTDTRSKNLIDLATERDELTTFVRVVQTAGMDTMLRNLGPFTIFAPTNGAFSRSPLRLDSLMTEAHRDTLRDILRYHIVRGLLHANRFRDSMKVSTMLEEPLTLRRTGPDSAAVLLVDGRRTTGPTQAQNGYLYTLSSVLRLPLPDTLEADTAAVATTPAP